MARGTKGSYRYMDVTGRIDCNDPQAVLSEARVMLARHHPRLDHAPLQCGFSNFETLYSGAHPDYHACDMAYHDRSHVLDVTLALIRLVDGYQRTHHDRQRLPGELCVVAILVALYHDVGYLRRRADHFAVNGAVYTRKHVTRGARFLRRYLPAIGYQAYARLAGRLVQFTGYEVDLAKLQFADQRYRRLGELIGTADILAQMSDRAYLDKCRDCLYPEFLLGGMTERTDAAGNQVQIYRDATQLLQKTPGFMDAAMGARLSGSFDSAWKYVEAVFDGANPYLEAIGRNRDTLQAALDSGDCNRLSAPFHPGWRPVAQ